MGESRISFAPKGAFGSPFGMVFYKHFTATRFSRLAPGSGETDHPETVY